MEVRISPAWRRDLRLLASTCCCWLKWLPARAKSSLLRGPPRIRCANNVDAIYAVHRSREVTQSLRSLVWPPPKCRTSRDFQWCSSRIWAQASSRTMASGSSGASGSRSRRATSFSAGSGVRAWTALSTTSTFASSGTGRRAIDLSTMSESGLHAYTRACGWSLARAHARSGDRLAIAAYLGNGPSFDRAIARFSTTYADQNELDHRRLADAVAAGEMTPQFGV